jgi:hypothetical protein
MLSCTERRVVRRRSIASLAASDWGEPPTVVIDLALVDAPKDRQRDNARRLLTSALDAPGDVFLFLEDDVVVNRSLRFNLEHWEPLVQRPPGGHFFASLYNPNIVPARAVDDPATWIEASPLEVYGSQALVLAVPTVEYVLDHWDEVPALQDHKLARLAAHLTPLLYHRPSLVQQLAVKSTWGGRPHEALDFEADWRADR